MFEKKQAAFCPLFTLLLMANANASQALQAPLVSSDPDVVCSTLQLHASTGSTGLTCWDSSFTPLDTKKNTSTQFKAVVR